MRPPRIVAAGRSNEEFASKIFSIAAPLSHAQKTSSFSAETYHVAHGRWETKAPMSVVIPLKEDGKTYVVGAFSCTPVVKYPIDALQPGHRGLTFQGRDQHTFQVRQIAATGGHTGGSVRKCQPGNF